MDIHPEQREQHTIQSYSDGQILVNGTIYASSCWLTKDRLEAWEVASLSDLTLEQLQPLLDQNPEVILLAQQQPPLQLPPTLLQPLFAKRIGVECLAIGAACRTFNLLLSEGRRVIAGFVFLQA